MATIMESVRPERASGDLLEGSAPSEPLALFQAWHDHGRADAPAGPTTMVLATVDADRVPSQRVVYLRGVDARGLVFFTNLRSPKARVLERNSTAALLLFWQTLERQVRIVGTAVPIDADESDAVFAQMPRAGQIGAIAIRQSETLPDRAALDQRYAEIEAELAERDPLTRPDDFGGLRVNPDSFEFWQGRPNRLHDRLRYRRGEDGTWIRERLAP